MNIQEAKNQVKYSVISYLSKDEFGEYKIPVERQRPLFLVGPPGVGKTEIISQVAEEMDIALVSYSMTHHTRQSALGLPFIMEKEYGGEAFRTTEYTMSEIIASVYDKMKETGKSEGILFLDEINCVSETLAPSMLQFLQMKIFGRHSLPSGWVVITAGNPLEYNNSAREFDLATLDRLKRIDVEPELAPWLIYAKSTGVHSAVLNYLEIKKEDFYSIRLTVDGKLFVTARGWVDLSEMIYLYEQNNIEINIALVSQYIQDERIARDFTAYYDLFFKYRKEYDIVSILAGTYGNDIVSKLKDSNFDERITIIRLLGDALGADFREEYLKSAVIERVAGLIKKQREELVAVNNNEAAAIIDGIAEDIIKELKQAKKAHSVTKINERIARVSVIELKKISKSIPEADENAKEVITDSMMTLNDEKKSLVKSISEKLDNAFHFVENAFGDDNEMTIFVRTLTEDKYSAGFLAKYGNKSYVKFNKNLFISDREDELIGEIDKFIN